jgi:hypothetical protein
MLVSLGGGNTFTALTSGEPLHRTHLVRRLDLLWILESLRGMLHRRQNRRGCAKVHVITTSEGWIAGTRNKTLRPLCARR